MVICIILKWFLKIRIWINVLLKGKIGGEYVLKKLCCIYGLNHIGTVKWLYGAQYIPIIVEIGLW